MSTEQEEQGRKPGCPPYEFGNALAWRWAREMPRPLKGGFLTMLYALRAMASASGYLRFSGDGKPIRIQDIAKAAGCREKDARRYLEAAVIAGVVIVEGQRRRGRPTLYAIVNCPWPNWAAAADFLKATARPRKAETAEEIAGSSGHGGPNPEEGPEEGEVRAAEARTDENAVRATEARMGSGHRGPIGSGHRGPNNPGVTQESNQERVVLGADVTERAGASEEQNFPRQEDDTNRLWRACRCGQPITRATRELCGGCLRDKAAAEKAGQAQEQAPQPVQGAFLMNVTSGSPTPPEDAPSPASWTRQDPAAPLRVCRCGREFRGYEPHGRCPDCVYAAGLDARAVSGA